MVRVSKKYLLLMLILIFAFVYRLFLMLVNTFPPGADIGLHNSVIYSITQSGNTGFLYNFYQMGGGLSLTFPGYHIFTSNVMMFTGLPDYLAQVVVVAFFSSFISVSAFLVTRSAWSESAAFIVALLVAVSRFDIEMLLWAGYPNVIALLLIPLTFYLYLQRARFSLAPFLVATSVLAGSIFLTHSLSAGIFVSITAVTVLFLLVSPKTFGVPRKTGLYWLLPLILGAIIVSPFLMEALPAYLLNNSTLTGIPESRLALLSTRVLPLELIVPLFGILFAFFLFSKRSSGRYLSLQFLLLAIWLVVPLVFTQGYLVGFLIDYNRFLYFVILPVMVFIAMLIDHGSETFARVIDTYHILSGQMQKTKKTTNKATAWISTHLTRKALYVIFTLVFLLFAFLAIPIFVTPSQGQAVANFYQTMTWPGYTAIGWAKQNTPADAVFVSDALYGWWFGGFAQRKTLSAVDPQYITVNREYAPANMSKNLLDTDFVIDNGYIQVREDGGYVGRHNPMFMAYVNWTYFPYGFFQFNGSRITLRGNQSIDVTQIPVTSMQLVGNSTNNPSIVVNKGNNAINYTEILTVSKGVLFANMTVIVESNDANVPFYLVDFSLSSQGVFQRPIGNTVAMLDFGAKECGQLIFAKSKPEITNEISSNPCLTHFIYNLQGQSRIEIQILIGLYPVTDSDMSSQANINKVLTGKVQTAQQPTTDLPMFTFDYRAEMQAYNISYIALRSSELYPKFAKDPAFELVFINDEVAIFKVKGNLDQDG